MTENYKHLYECMKEMVQKYQDEIVPGLREQLEKRVEVVRCRDCKYYKEGELLAPEKFCFRLMHPTENRRIGYNFADDDFCSCGERKGNEA